MVKDIGIPTKAVLAANPHICETTDQDIAALLRSRPQNSHKGTFGRLGLVCGSDDMPGAAALAVSAALRSGVGLAELASVPSVVQRSAAGFPSRSISRLRRLAAVFPPKRLTRCAAFAVARRPWSSGAGLAAAIQSAGL